MNSKFASSVLICALLANACAHGATLPCEGTTNGVEVSIDPLQPLAWEDVHIVLRNVEPLTLAPEHRAVFFSDGRFTVRALSHGQATDGTIIGMGEESFYLAALPAGAYAVDVLYGYRGTGGVPPGDCLVKQIEFEVSPGPSVGTHAREFSSFGEPIEVVVPNRSGAAYHGLWWNPSSPGWAIALYEGPVTDVLAGVLIGYSESGDSSWISFRADRWESPDRVQISAVVTRSSPGSAFLRGGTAVKSGQGYLTWNGLDQMNIELQIPGEPPIAAEALRFKF